MYVKSFVLPPIGSNCYLLVESREPGAKAVIIDPGSTDLDVVFSYVDEHKLSLVANWNTHAHLDHVLGVDLVREKYQIESLVHEADAAIWDDVHGDAKRFLRADVPPLQKPDGWLQDGQELQFGPETFTVVHTPGHTPGSVCLVGESIAFTGDTLFKGSMGRVDFPYSSERAMKQSLRRCLKWPDSLILYPGHMQPTTLGAEKRSNPFFQKVWLDA